MAEMVAKGARRLLFYGNQLLQQLLLKGQQICACSLSVEVQTAPRLKAGPWHSFANLQRKPEYTSLMNSRHWHSIEHLIRRASLFARNPLQPFKSPARSYFAVPCRAASAVFASASHDLPSGKSFIPSIHSNNDSRESANARQGGQVTDEHALIYGAWPVSTRRHVAASSSPTA